MLIRNVYKKYQKTVLVSSIQIIQVRNILFWLFQLKWSSSGTLEYPESCTSNDSQYNLNLEDDQYLMKERLTPENDNKLIEVIPVHDDDNDLTRSK